MVVIGLTGNMASGKSTALQMLADMGAAIIEADKIGHEQLQSGTEVWQKIIQTWGRGMLGENEQIDRARLGKIIFNQPGARKKLDKITHPHIQQAIQERIEKYRHAGCPAVVVEIPLLIETKWTGMVDQVWVISASENTSIKRMIKRSGFSREEATSRLKSQLPLEEKLRHADVIIDAESEDKSRMKLQLEKAWKRTIGKGSPSS